jgi:hypothetical protein
MTHQPDEIVAEFGQRLADLGWVRTLQVGGSLATGDHRAGVSDLDLVALTSGPLTAEQRLQLISLHEAVPPAAKLGCTYVPAQLVGVLSQKHATWTHGQLIQRRLSGIARAELVQHGYAVFGREPPEVWQYMSAEDISRAVADELTGYWSWAVRRPWLWFSTAQIDLAVTTMLRARHAWSTGELITKSAALGAPQPAGVPGDLIQAVRARRNGQEPGVAARVPLDALDAWRLTRRTIATVHGVTSRG